MHARNVRMDSDVNTMQFLGWSTDQLRYVTLGVRSCSCTYWPDAHGWGKLTDVRCQKCKASITTYADEPCVCGCRKRTYTRSAKSRTCDVCQGYLVVPQNDCDYIPRGILANAPVRVYRDIEQNAQYLKQLDWDNRYRNILWSCSGCIVERELDNALIARVRSEGTCQAIKIIRNHVIAHHIGVVVDGQYGYTVRAIFQEDPWVPIEEVTDYFVRKARLEASSATVA